MNNTLIAVLFGTLAFPILAEDVLWRVDKGAQAYCTKDKETVCFVVVNETVTNVSAIESKNIGKLGITLKENYEKVVTFPSKWLSSTNQGDLVEFTTQAWLKSKRYTARGMVFVDNNGKYIHQ
ncbi:hypothetical protein [Pseudoalteromonas sp. PPB1]|uniref:hypothetical protein n=1 Tax=Pseudoalteromonas sp. PPB1 TaxID=2756136 RepID=UPI001890E566|nr:hypothetical protein [Pseudoalteromonas sp. PPB1]